MRPLLLLVATGVAALAASARPAAAADSWTSSNVHDPGITLLQVLVYAPSWRDWSVLIPVG
jgi:hypothetical protein